MEFATLVYYVTYFIIPASIVLGVLLSMLAKVFKVHASSDLLMEAAEKGDHKTALEVLKSSAKNIALDGRNSKQMNALHILAQQKGSEECIRTILQRGNMDAMQRGKSDWTALHYAAEVDNCRAAKALLEGGVQVDAVSEDGWTALHVACMKRAMNVMQVLLDAGADETKKTTMGQTAFELQLAARGKYLRAMQVDAFTEARRRARSDQAPGVADGNDAAENDE